MLVVEQQTLVLMVNASAAPNRRVLIQVKLVVLDRANVELLILVLLLSFDVVLPTLPHEVLDIPVEVDETAPPTRSIWPFWIVPLGDGVLELTMLLQWLFVLFLCIVPDMVPFEC